MSMGAIEQVALAMKFNSEVIALKKAIQRVRDLENEPCNDKCSSLSCQHWGIRRAVRALDGKPETGSLHGEEFTYCAAKGGEQA